MLYRFRLLTANLGLLLLTGLATGQQVAINEFLASNDTTVTDQDGEYDDWVELYNSGDTSFDLTGCFLSDEAANPTRWQFPDTVIAAGQFLIVWADGDLEQTGLHTDFRLSASGEELLLSDSAAQPLDFVNFGPQSADISSGRYPDGWGPFQSMLPTFAAPNQDETPDEEEDPSRALFNFETVHDFELEFYVDEWADSLEQNYNAGEVYMPARLFFGDSLLLDSIGVRYKGNSSYLQAGNTPKKPFKLRFDKYVEDQRLLGLQRLNFNNCINDPSFMREPIAYHIASTIMPASRTAYANLYIEGELIGLYLLAEQLNEDFLARWYSDNGGNLFKAADDGATLLYRGDSAEDYTTEYELKTNETANDWSGLITLIENLNNLPDEQFAESMLTILDLDLCLRNLAFNMVLSHFDSYTGSGRNFYLYEDETSGQFQFLPWDLNETFGVYSAGWDVINQDIYDISNLASRPLNRRLLEQPDLRQQYSSLIRMLASGVAAEDSIIAWTDLLYPLIDQHVLADQNKLYSYQDFQNNISQTVLLALGREAPGLHQFARERNQNLLLQTSDIRIYPGDTDNNGLVDALDILPLAVWFHEQGIPRPDPTLDWEGQPAWSWENPAATWSDANGDGVVDEVDAIAVAVNWNNSHSDTLYSWSINPMDPQLPQEYGEQLMTLYSSMSGEGRATAEIRELLETILQIEATLPDAYSLEQNHPNPFNLQTEITFNLPRTSRVTVTLYNMLGQVVALAVQLKQYQAGRHHFTLNCAGLPTGVYFCQLSTGDWTAVQKILLIK